MLSFLWQICLVKKEKQLLEWGLHLCWYPINSISSNWKYFITIIVFVVHHHHLHSLQMTKLTYTDNRSWLLQLLWKNKKSTKIKKDTCIHYNCLKSGNLCSCKRKYVRKTNNYNSCQSLIGEGKQEHRDEVCQRQGCHLSILNMTIIIQKWHSSKNFRLATILKAGISREKNQEGDSAI